MAPMRWHIINHRDYIDGPFETFDYAVQEAHVLGKETRSAPRLQRRAKDFYIYRAPYDRQEQWQPEYWICTKEAALREGVPEEIFLQPLSQAG